MHNMKYKLPARLPIDREISLIEIAHLFCRNKLTKIKL